MNRTRLVAVPLAGLAAILTRWPDPVLGSLATILALAWLATALLCDRHPRLHFVSPLLALGLVTLPTAARPVVPFHAFVVGIAVAFAVIASLPSRSEAVQARAGPAAWTPFVLVAALLLLPLLLPALLGPDRISAMADRTAPALLTLAAMLLSATAIGYTLLTHKEVRA